MTIGTLCSTISNDLHIRSSILLMGSSNLITNGVEKSTTLNTVFSALSRLYSITLFDDCNHKILVITTVCNRQRIICLRGLCRCSVYQYKNTLLQDTYRFLTLIVPYLNFHVNARRLIDARLDHRQFHKPVDGHKVRVIVFLHNRHDFRFGGENR